MKKRLLSATRFILKFFIEKYWNKKKSAQKRKIFQRRSKTIDKKIKHWENCMNTGNNISFEVEEAQNLLNIKNKLEDFNI